MGSVATLARPLQVGEGAVVGSGTTGVRLVRGGTSSGSITPLASRSRQPSWLRVATHTRLESFWSMMHGAPSLSGASRYPPYWTTPLYSSVSMKMWPLSCIGTTP